MRAGQLILYRNMADQDLLERMEKLFETDTLDLEESSELAGRLVELADTYGLEGNLPDVEGNLSGCPAKAYESWG